MFKKKIFLFLMAAAVSTLLLSSVSFTTEVADVSGSFVVRASIANKGADTPVVKTVANIKVEALTGSLVSSVEENVEKASKDIYAAYKKAEEERIRQEEARKLAAEQAKKAEES